jgi:glycosyltransferase involved in cell wall biosynthesis
MKIALVAPPFIPIPPVGYGGTELFVALLAEGLTELGHDVIVYGNGESTVDAEVRWIYHDAEWPLTGKEAGTLKEIHHSAWAVHDAAQCCDIIHVNSTLALPSSHFVKIPFVHTIHHVHDNALTEFYSHYPNTHYVTISEFGRQQETMLHVHTIHHGINVSQYKFSKEKQPYLTFLGRIVPVKGVHLAIEVAKKSGIPLKIAGEVQPIYHDYFEQEIKPHIDGKLIEYVGEANFEAKNELLANSSGLLFPIGWDEPFGLVMIEAMACGTPVLAFPGGSVPEVVEDGASGYVCASVDEMVERLPDLRKLDPTKVREYVERNFSVPCMARKYAALYSALAGVQTPGSLSELAQTEHPVA